MNQIEISRLIKFLQAEYSGHQINDVEALVQSWQMILGEVPFEAAAEAARSWIASGERFFPTSGQLFQLVAIGAGALPTDAEAWERVLARMRATYPGIPAPPWDVPDIVKRALAAIGGMDVVRVHEEPEILRSQFAKFYNQFRQRAATSPAVMGAIASSQVSGALDAVPPALPMNGRRHG